MGKEIIILKNILSNHPDKSDMYKRNLIKEYLQILVLGFIYSNAKYKDLFFYGGTCLAQCFGLPRLSEDLDFVDIKKEVDMNKMSVDIKDFFEKKTDLPISVKVQKFRIYLKFPILKELGLSENSESDVLFLKVEVFSS